MKVGSPEQRRPAFRKRDESCRSFSVSKGCASRYLGSTGFLRSSQATRSLSSSGWRDENSTGCPDLTHNPPIVPPIWQDPITPMGSLVLLFVGAAEGHECNAASRAKAPPKTSKVRRELSKGIWFRIETSS